MSWHAFPCMWRQNIQRLHLEFSTSRILGTRSLSTQITDSHGNAGHDIYVSTSTNPYFNLALENWYVFAVYRTYELLNSCQGLQYSRLFRHSSPSSPLLLIYRDSPCVVIGRHQNPWTEINFTTLRAARIPFIRRWSGGGAVYHVDLSFFLFPIAVTDRFPLVVPRIWEIQISLFISRVLPLTERSPGNSFFVPFVLLGLMPV